jgi:hypothetical protein
VTRETRTVVDLRDILGVEIECPKCKAKVLIPANVEVPNVDHRCFQCHADWFSANFQPTGQTSSAAAKQIQKLIEMIRLLSSGERSDIYAPVRLLIGGLED